MYFKYQVHQILTFHHKNNVKLKAYKTNKNKEKFELFYN